MEVCPDLTEEEAEKALSLCNNKYERHSSGDSCVASAAHNCNSGLHSLCCPVHDLCPAQLPHLACRTARSGTRTLFVVETASSLLDAPLQGCTSSAPPSLPPNTHAQSAAGRAQLVLFLLRPSSRFYVDSFRSDAFPSAAALMTGRTRRPRC